MLLVPLPQLTALLPQLAALLVVVVGFTVIMEVVVTGVVIVTAYELEPVLIVLASSNLNILRWRKL